jgi:hypothetical protein
LFTLREELTLRVFKNMVLRGIFGPKWDKVKVSGEYYIMKSSMICTTHPLLFS